MVSTNLTFLLLVIVSAGLTEAFMEGFMDGFNRDFSEKMKAMQTELNSNMAKLNQTMVNMKLRLDAISKMTASDLAMRVHSNESESIFNLGGCFCKNLNCECCGFIDVLSKDQGTVNYCQN